jgi:hypothetical protein
MPHGSRCAKKTLLRKTKPSVPQLHTGMRCGSVGFACQSVTLSQARDPGNRAATESRKPSFRPPLELSGDPQISPTRPLFKEPFDRRSTRDMRNWLLFLI